MNILVKHLLVLLIAATSARAAAPALPCESLAAKTFGKEVTLHSATPVPGPLVPDKGNLPAHCDVRGVIWPEARFALKLPTDWNDRFQMVGNGGTAGVISLGAVDSALRLGFAAVSTDTGHDAAKEPLATFAHLTPENPNAHRKFVDFAYLSVHETAVLAKQIIQAYYGTRPKYSYWVGCSTGGRQGLQEAQRYPEDFDGLVIGAPGLFLTGNVMRRMWVAQSQLADGALPPEKLPLLHQLVYKKCDPADGLADGVIDDPRRCDFLPKRDLPLCVGPDAATCFTAPQLAALTKIYGGVRNSKGKLLFPGEPVGSELVWVDNLIAPNKTVLPRSESQMKFYVLDPSPGPSWTYPQFNFDRDPPRTARAAKDLNPMNPDLAPLKKRGGKIIQYSGWADQQVNPFPGIQYYETVSQRLGPAPTRDFYRLFMVPGMLHCAGGPGCANVNWLAALTDWVEKGVAPTQILGSHLEKAQVTRTRPLCPYPEVARYKGSGSTDEAANFACQLP